MVAQRNGIIIFYNIVKQHAVQSVSVGKSPLLYVDWAPSNNYFVGCVSYSQAYIVDVAKPYSTHIKSFDTHPNFTNKFKFSPLDYKMFATMGRSDSRIKVFQLNFQSILWSNKKPDMRDIEWLRARPFVLALAGSRVYLFKSSILH
jgi:WD40 repeat protein